jgi:hypothetical protein
LEEKGAQHQGRAFLLDKINLLFTLTIAGAGTIGGRAAELCSVAFEEVRTSTTGLVNAVLVVLVVVERLTLRSPVPLLLLLDFRDDAAAGFGAGAGAGATATLVPLSLFPMPRISATSPIDELVLSFSAKAKAIK